MNNLLYKFNEGDINHKKTISLCVDIRKSTELHNNFPNKTKPAKIVATFISKCYVICKNQAGLFSNYIYAGDGLIAVAYRDNNVKAFEKTLNAAIKISEVIEEFKNNYKNKFDAGIGIAFDDTAEVKVKDLPTQYNNILYVGNSISVSSKICGCMPLKNSKYNIPIYIGMSNDFAENLPQKFLEKCKKTSKKYIYLGDNYA